MKLSPEDLGKIGCYKMLSSVVVPRPIAWITTMSKDGLVNLAPFSFFTPVSKEPPKLMFCISKQKPGYGHELKDTDRNIHDTGEFVIHIPSVEFAEQVDQCGDFHGPNISEVELLGLKTTPSEVVKVPRLVDVPVAMECVLSETMAFSKDRLLAIVGEIKMFHVRDDLYNPQTGLVDSFALNPLMRVASPDYATLGKRITVPDRPNAHRPLTGGKYS